MRKTKFEPGKVYHIFNRGVEKRDVFLSDGGRWRFLQGMYLFNDENTSANLLFRLEQEKGKMHFGILREYMKKSGVKRKPLVKILADCLKPNHYHLLLEEIQKNGISRFMHKLGTGYTMYFNKKYERVGSLFQGPYKAVPVKTNEHLMYLLAYINVINPGQELEPELKSVAQDPEEILRFAEHYPWSTHLEYLGKRQSIIAEKGIAGTLFKTPKIYREFVAGIIRGKKPLQAPDTLLIE
ncbi:MAG: transposase [Candidatus Wildermuthbacteria bacterium]|nr:transposase [Candidatus Wildermuthbacteria bacterium]